MKKMIRILAAALLCLPLGACTKETAKETEETPTPSPTETASASPSVSPTAPVEETQVPESLLNQDIAVDFDLMVNCPRDSMESVQNYLISKGYDVTKNNIHTEGQTLNMTVKPANTDAFLVQYQWTFGQSARISCMTVPANGDSYPSTGGYDPDTPEFWADTMNRAGYTEVYSSPVTYENNFTVTDTVYEKDGDQLTVETSRNGDTLLSSVLIS
jgi:hypothetical protein